MLDANDLKTLKDLAKKFEAANKDAVLQIVQADMHDVFQAAHDQGHSAATTKAESKVTAATSAKEKAEADLAAANTTIAELRKNTPPSVQELQQRHDRAIQDLQNQHKTEKEGLVNQLQEVKIDQAMDLLVATLADDFGVDKEYSNTILKAKQDLRKRVRFSEAGHREILQAGKDIAIVGNDQKSDVQLWAAEVAKTVPEKFVNSKVNRGSGTRGSMGGSEQNGNEYDAIRTEMKAKQEERAKTRTGSAGLERLGGVRGR